MPKQDVNYQNARQVMSLPVANPHLSQNPSHGSKIISGFCKNPSIELCCLCCGIRLDQFIQAPRRLFAPAQRNGKRGHFRTIRAA
jgi:hypothetical protein